MVWQSNLSGLGDATSRVPLTKLNMATLCNNDKLARIKFAIVASNPAATELDSVLTTVDEIQKGKHNYDMDDGSKISLREVSIKVQPSFVDYIRSGWSISFVAAIDYTASNGEPN